MAPAARYRSAAGVILGMQRRWTTYGFRRVPYERRIRVAALVATRDWVPGVEASMRVNRENSPFGYSIGGRAIAYHTLRFYGFGNDSPEPASDASRRVRQEEYRAAAHLNGTWDSGFSFAAGPFVRYTDVVEADTFAPFGALPDSLGASTFGAVGLEADLTFGWGARGAAPTDADDAGTPDEFEAAEVDVSEELDPTDEDHDPHDREPIDVLEEPTFLVETSVGGSWVPAAWDAAEAFGEAHALTRGRFRLPGDHGPELGVRLGGQRVWGGFPFHEAAYVGSLRTLRGFRTFRYAGESAAYGSVEFGVPLFDMELMLRGRVGVFGLVDVGRVWVGGESPGGWHSGVGGGVSFRSLGRVIRIAAVNGEDLKFYFDLGWP
jgi:hypothetical protein